VKINKTQKLRMQQLIALMILINDLVVMPAVIQRDC